MQRIAVNPDDRFGDLKALREVSSPGKRRFLCQCACGQQVTARLDHLRSGHTSSCGNCGVEHKGQRRTVREWASLYGIKESTLRARLKAMKIGEALERG